MHNYYYNQGQILTSPSGSSFPSSRLLQIPFLFYTFYNHLHSVETLVMDQDCSTPLSLGLSPGTGTSTRQKDHDYVSHRNANGPPVELDLFPLAPVLPPEPRCGTLLCEKTSPGQSISIFLAVTYR